MPTINGEEVTQEVFDAARDNGELEQCPAYGDWWYNEDMIPVFNERNCEDGLRSPPVVEETYRRCPETENLMPRASFVRLASGERISNYAFENGCYFTCEACGLRYPDDYYAENGHCVNCDNERSALIGEYHGIDPAEHLGFFNDERHTMGPIGDRLYFGVELEVETSGAREACAQRVLDALGAKRVLLQEDGSLNSGFEIITAPMTLKRQRELWQDFTRSAARGLTSHNTSTCGMHVHVSSAALTGLQLGRVLVLVNAADNKEFIECIAQRGNCEYARKRDKRLTHGKTRPVFGAWAEDYLQGDATQHYDAINVGNSRTVEFRLFKGNTRVDRIVKNLEFVDALLAYCKINADTSAAAFVAWLTLPENRKSWPVLYSYLCEKGYATPYSKACKELRANPINESENN